MTIFEIKESTSVQAHINMMQGMINRMASNSANCKLWCITLLVVLLGLFLDKKIARIESCYFVLGIFYFLDCFYLGLERQFVKTENDFVTRINDAESESDIAAQIFLPYPKKESRAGSCWFRNKIKHFIGQLWNTLKAVGSFSTTPFYSIAWVTIYYMTKNS